MGFASCASVDTLALCTPWSNSAVIYIDRVAICAYVRILHMGNRKRSQTRARYSDSCLHSGTTDALQDARRCRQLAQEASTMALAEVAVYDIRYQTRVVGGKVTKLPRRASAHGGVSGLSQMRKLNYLLDQFVDERFDAQKRIHEGMLGACMQLIFRNSKDSDMKLARAEIGMRKSKQQFMAITPRRFGKTYAVAMYVAAMVLACPDVSIAIFSTAKRASELLLRQAVDFILSIKGTKDRIKSCSADCVVIRHGTRESKLCSYPATART